MHGNVVFLGPVRLFVANKIEMNTWKALKNTMIVTLTTFVHFVRTLEIQPTDLLK